MENVLSEMFKVELERIHAEITETIQQKTGKVRSAFKTFTAKFVK